MPLILFKTRSDFAQQGIIPDVGGAGAIARGEVTSFSEPRRNRVVILVEEEPDRLYRLITHELTHIFAFDIIPRSPTNVRRVASWIDEGFAEYMTGVWDPDDLSRCATSSWRTACRGCPRLREAWRVSSARHPPRSRRL